MTATSLPQTETRITQAHFIRRKIEVELERVQEGDAAPLTVRTLDASWRRAIETGTARGLSALLHLVSSNTPIVSRIGFLNRHGIPAPFTLRVQGDDANHAACRILIEEGTPNIGVPEYWTSPHYSAHRKHYQRYIETLAARIGIPEMKHGFTAEREFAATTTDADPHLFTWSSLNATFRRIDWAALFVAWGLDAAALPRAHYTIASTAFVHHLQARLSWSPARWNGWLMLLVAQWYAGCSPPGPLRDAWFAYNRRFLQGLAMDEDAAAIRRAAVRSLLPNTVGRVWVDWLRRTRDADVLRKRVSVLAENIRRAAIRALQGADWMAPTTCSAATAKLRALAIEVGWPTGPWVDEKLTLGSSASLIENMLSIAVASTRSNQSLLDAGTCRSPQKQAKQWNYPVSVFEVNAYYFPEENRFILPVAILRPPFYDERRPDAWNYGAIGATIGHELCHAFDSDGRLFDARGDKRDWWTRADDKRFRRKASSVKRLYETRKYRGLSVDGELTMVENIADIGGLEFALAALKEQCTVTPAILRTFFTAFAVSWRSKDIARRAAELLVVDPHAPPMLRVNHVVRQMDAWYEAFGVGPECDEYIPPERRIRFWS